MSTPEARLDHFLIYDIADIGVNYDGATFEGHFDTKKGPMEVNIRLFEVVATPVSKDGGAIVNDNAHFTGYFMRVERPGPERTIVIENQFGEQTIRTGLGSRLLAPAEEVERGLSLPEGLDHYKAYGIVAADPVDAVVSLKDQFDSREAVSVTTPVFSAYRSKRYLKGRHLQSSTMWTI